MNDITSHISSLLDKEILREHVLHQTIARITKEQKQIKHRIRQIEIDALFDDKNDTGSSRIIQTIKELSANRSLYKKGKKQLDFSQDKYIDSTKKIKDCLFWYNYADTNDVTKQNEALRRVSKI